MFGAFLVRSGAGEFVIDLSRAIAGRIQGGPGFVADFFGIDRNHQWQRSGEHRIDQCHYHPDDEAGGIQAPFAGAVEASASTGGQLMPPIMGAGAFVMAAYAQIPYESIAATAAVPAFLYFASVISLFASKLAS